MMENSNPTPQPMKVELVTAPQYPLGTLYYVWKQSRSNKQLPMPERIENILLASTLLTSAQSAGYEPGFWFDCYDDAEGLGFPPRDNTHHDPESVKACAKHIRDEIEMILHESIPVVENLHFVFHLQNIPISLREQLVRHRIGVNIDPRIGVDIIPEPLSGMMLDAPQGSLMHMQVVPDLAESTWWSQTSRVIPFDTFYDEGRFIVPEGLKGKNVKICFSQTAGDITIDNVRTVTAEQFYLDHLQKTQEAYRKLMEAGVHIEDCRNLIPVGATHGITWGINLKAMLHIFGKRSSWIAQIGIWGNVMGQMADELCNKVHPMFRMVLMPQCVKKGKYVGCPVSGTNAERVSGIDGMPPCPLWVRYENEKALQAVDDTLDGKFPGRDLPAWIPPSQQHSGTHPENEPSILDVREWSNDRPVEKEMLYSTSEIYSKLWGFDVLEGLPDGE